MLQSLISINFSIESSTVQFLGFQFCFPRTAKPMQSFVPQQHENEQPANIQTTSPKLMCVFPEKNAYFFRKVAKVHMWSLECRYVTWQIRSCRHKLLSMHFCVRYPENICVGSVYALLLCALVYKTQQIGAWLIACICAGHKHTNFYKCKCFLKMMILIQENPPVHLASMKSCDQTCKRNAHR
jgi:hypothetical protein